MKECCVLQIVESRGWPPKVLQMVGKTTKGLKVVMEMGQSL